MYLDGDGIVNKQLKSGVLAVTLLLSKYDLKKMRYIQKEQEDQEDQEEQITVNQFEHTKKNKK